MKANPKGGTISKRMARKLRRWWNDCAMAARKAQHRRRIGPPKHKTAAFVVGCQRSGTDMTIKTLDRSLDVDRFDEYDPRAFVDCRMRDRATRDGLIARSTARCIIFKPVCDSHRVDDLLDEHAGGRAVWVYRKYDDVANSAVERWGDEIQRWLEDLLDGGGDWGTRQWNRERVTEACVADVREAAAAGLTPHGAASLFWYMRNRTCFEQNLPDRDDVAIVRYEDVVSRPKDEVERLCRFLDVSFNDHMVRGIFGSSVRKQPFPPIPPSIRRLCDEMLERLDAVRRGESCVPV